MTNQKGGILAVQDSANETSVTTKTRKGSITLPKEQNIVSKPLTVEIPPSIASKEFAKALEAALLVWEDELREHESAAEKIEFMRTKAHEAAAEAGRLKGASKATEEIRLAKLEKARAEADQWLEYRLPMLVEKSAWMGIEALSHSINAIANTMNMQINFHQSPNGIEWDVKSDLF